MNGGRWRLAGSVRWWLNLLLAALLLAPASAGADLIRLGDVDVPQLSSALKRSPVQTAGRPDPTLTPGERRALAARIAREDRGRLWIAVVSPVSPQQTGELAQTISNAVNPAGAVIVVAGSNYHVTTTWGSGDAAGERLSKAVSRPGDPLADQLRRTIDSFAKADAAAGHPGSSAAQSQPTQNGGATTANPGATTGTPGAPTPSSGGGSSGLIGALVVLAVILIPTALIGGRITRRRLRASHWRREESADARTQADADLVKLGEDIGALDIDSSMPNASAQGKDQYGKAIDCYQEAERRLKSSGDDYQFERGREALARGRQHLEAASALFGGSGPTQAAPGPSFDGTAVEQLQRLAALHDRGALTDEEFAEQKRLLIGD